MGFDVKLFISHYVNTFVSKNDLSSRKNIYLYMNNQTNNIINDCMLYFYWILKPVIVREFEHPKIYDCNLLLSNACLKYIIIYGLKIMLHIYLHYFVSKARLYEVFFGNI